MSRACTRDGLNWKRFEAERDMQKWHPIKGAVSYVSDLANLTQKAGAEVTITSSDANQHPASLDDDGGPTIVDRTPVAFADALDELLQDHERCAKMGNTWQEWAMHDLAPERLSDQFMNLFKRALDHS